MTFKARQFVFKDYHFDQKKNLAHFEYEITFDDMTSIPFEETITFPTIKISYPKLRPLETILKNLNLILGISYYKLYCPRDIIINDNFLDQEGASFWNSIYTKGLGEFFYKNEIDFRGLINFPY